MIHKPTNQQVQPDQHYLYTFARSKFGGKMDASCLVWRKVKLLEEVQQLIEL